MGGQFIKSKSEVERLIKQGAIELDGVKVSNRLIPLSEIKREGSILRIGKRRFLKIIPVYQEEKQDE